MLEGKGEDKDKFEKAIKAAEKLGEAIANTTDKIMEMRKDLDLKQVMIMATSRCHDEPFKAEKLRCECPLWWFPHAFNTKKDISPLRYLLFENVARLAAIFKKWCISRPTVSRGSFREIY